ncbi:hypothetical protein [Cereibacter azotoformans]|uniref:Sulfotransferase domain-containing protein n=1 Tax=Cereibacter azotoformans TaxID=43057 RepID=A0A2T5JR55_9RHOB|nr:hypothetical protein [Cereibacter azotoformans]PTR10473.1 hypothetical protein C8J28_13024 [Cereibacter azotoformans]
MARIWLHIGHGKTGTSSIQWAMADRSRLRRDVIYPVRGRGDQMAHHGLFPLKEAAYGPEIIQVLRQLSQRLASVNIPVLLSSEHLCHASERKVTQIARAFAGHELRVVYYIRRQDDLLESSFRQRQSAQPGAFPDPNLFLERFSKGFDFESRLQPWRAVFGDEAITVRLYHPEVVGSDVVGDIERLLGLPDWPDRAPAQRNPSLTAAGTRKVMQAATASPDEARRLARELRGVDTDGDNSPFYDESNRRMLMERYHLSNRRVAEQFLDEESAALLLKA